MTKPLNLHVKTPRYIPMHELTMIVGGHEQGMTQKAIKHHIDQGRKMAGTYKGQGISTNTISRLKVHAKAEEYKEKIEEAWMIHARRQYQKASFEDVAARIKDPKEQALFRKFARRIVERSSGLEYRLEVEYRAEDDSYYAYSP